MALEEERFDILPGTAYAKGFLRTYADHLGLDAQRFVDEYNSRFSQEEWVCARRRRILWRGPISVGAARTLSGSRPE